jgi:hypothetical protein
MRVQRERRTAWGGREEECLGQIMRKSKNQNKRTQSSKGRRVLKNGSNGDSVSGAWGEQRRDGEK